MNGGTFFLLLHCQFFFISGTFSDIFLSHFAKWKIEGRKGVSPPLSLSEFLEFLGFDSRFLMVHHPCADLFESDWIASRHEYHGNVRKQEHKVMRKLINFRRFSLFSWMCLLRVLPFFFVCSLFHLALRSRIHQGGKISFLPSPPPLSLKRDIKYATRLFFTARASSSIGERFQRRFEIYEVGGICVILCLVFGPSSCKSDLMCFYRRRADEHEKSSTS